ncbi:hypothetical protein GCM10022223_27270 [Kineosporia mesophila]|uniref:DUF885 domain-containing protein n=1 Tax=Kineosporia mesophila TaxID=566012 RepID=A0ABP6ZI52_9ACTN|nr:flavohemoglobin expression-modulating QEGLA motif protein [Kineosporia mesophila]MCD5353537.1 flavohemoglobin expression-modulating QEGLA motif protein [Kineosporia mesophila]
MAEHRSEIAELRDRVEQVIRSWHGHESGRGGEAVIDYDCAPNDRLVTPAAGRLDVYEQFTDLSAQADALGTEAGDIADVLTSHRAYLGEMLGQRMPLGDYLRQTQGCGAGGWDEDYLLEVRDQAIKAVSDLGVQWGRDLDHQLNELEQPVTSDDAVEQIPATARALETVLRDLVHTSAPYEVRVEITDVDEYWAYWLDGAGPNVRLRFNRRNATFTQAQVRVFAMHELLGHAVQFASYAQVCATQDVPWVRLLSVNGPYQVMLEGLAQAMPLFLTPDDAQVVARVRLAHYLQLVRGELHTAINAGATVAECADHARARVPFWTSAAIGDILTDRGANPLLRSYLWSYSAGIDWWVNLADHADADTRKQALRDAYQRPLTPRHLHALWPDGPRLGGPGAAVRLRKPALP